MKKFLIIILSLALLGGLSFGGYELFKNKDKLFPKNEREEREESVSSSPSSNGSQAIEYGVLTEDNGSEDIAKLKRARENNRDAVAWLRVPGTIISSPVMQSHDNNFYLRKNEKKESDIFGCYFADCDNNISTRSQLDGNIVIYGHSDLQDNPEGKRFSQLFKFVDEDFARENSKIYLSLLDEELCFEIFSVFYSSGNPSYINIMEKGSRELAELIQNIKESSIFDLGIEVKQDYNIIILSTCSVKEGTDFLAVAGRLA